MVSETWKSADFCYPVQIVLDSVLAIYYIEILYGYGIFALLLHNVAHFKTCHIPQCRKESARDVKALRPVKSEFTGSKFSKGLNCASKFT